MGEIPKQAGASVCVHLCSSMAKPICVSKSFVKFISEFFVRIRVHSWQTKKLRGRIIRCNNQFITISLAFSIAAAVGFSPLSILAIAVILSSVLS